MPLDKNKILRLFKIKSAEINKIHIEEIKKLSQKYGDKATGSGIFLSSHIDLLEKYFKDILRILIESIFDEINSLDKINKNDEKAIIELLKDKTKDELSSKQNNIKALMASIGLNIPAIREAHMSTLSGHFNEELNLKIDYVKHLIEKHNFRAEEQKKSSGFWNTKNGTITAIATSIIAVTGIIAFLFSIGIFSSKNSYQIEPPVLKKFELSAKEILLGESVRLYWNVSNADSVILNDNIGKITLSGSKLFTPNMSTIFRLSAYLNNIELVITKTVIVKDSLGNIL